MNLTRKTYTTRREKIIDFVIGFVGSIVISAALGFALTFLTAFVGQLPSSSSDSSSAFFSYLVAFLNCVPLIINVAAIIFFAFTRHWIALGILAVWVIGLMITLCATIFLAVLCFVPGAFR